MFVLDFIAMHWMMILGVCVAVLVLFLIIFRSSLIRLEILQRIGAIGERDPGSRRLRPASGAVRPLMSESASGRSEVE
jgi:hypothetical protein